MIQPSEHGISENYGHITLEALHAFETILLDLHNAIISHWTHDPYAVPNRSLVVLRWLQRVTIYGGEHAMATDA